MFRKSPLKRKTPMKRKRARHAPNAEEKAYHARVRQVQCVVGNSECGGRTTVSHRPGAGVGLKSPHDQVAALCEKHHLHGPTSIEYMGYKAWRSRYGPHEHYEQLTREAVDKL